jgi:hypothetical protein
VINKLKLIKQLRTPGYSQLQFLVQNNLYAPEVQKRNFKYHMTCVRISSTVFPIFHSILNSSVFLAVVFFELFFFQMVQLKLVVNNKDLQGKMSNYLRTSYFS